MPVSYCKGGQKYPKLELCHVPSGSSGTLLIYKNEMEIIINLYLGIFEWIFILVFFSKAS